MPNTDEPCGRRAGDDRPLHRPPGQPVRHLPERGEPLRWLPRHGEPYCTVEVLSQLFIRTLAYWPVYTACVSTLILLIVVFHPWGVGR